MSILLKNFRRKAPSGFTLIEFMGVMLLAAILIFLVMRQQNAANITESAKSIASSASVIQLKAAKLFSPTFAAMTDCTALANNGVFGGTSFRVDKTGGTPVVSYSQEAGTAITCAATNLFGTNDAFAMTLPNLSDDLCAEMVDQVGALAWRVDINGVNIKPPRGVINPDLKGEQCSAAGTSNVQEVRLVFSRQAAPQ